MLPTHEEISKRYISSFEYFPSIINRLEVLSVQKQVVFLACCNERMLLNYYLVEGLPGWGKKAILENGMSQIWKIARKEQIDPIYISNLIEDVIECASNPDEYPASNYYVVGFSPIGGISCLLESGLTLKPSDILEAFANILGTLNDYIELELISKNINITDKNEQEKMKIIMNNRVIQVELENQKSDLNILENSIDLTLDLIENLRINARNHSWKLKRIPKIS